MGRPRLYSPEEAKIRGRESCARYRAKTRAFHRSRGRKYYSENRDTILSRNRARDKAHTLSIKKKMPEGMKSCGICAKSKPFREFDVHPGAADKFRSYCKECRRVKARANFAINRESVLAWNREYRKRNLEKVRRQDLLRRRKNPELFKQRARLRFQRVKDVVRAKKLKRRHSDVSYRVECNLRSRLNILLRRRKLGSKVIKSDRLESLLGCSFSDFVLYVESKFEPGMSWENYGNYPGWHIDHEMPCSIFDLSKPEHQRRCFHFSNLQPMWAAENISKNAKVLTNQFKLL